MQLHLDNCHLAWLDSKPVEMYINANRSAGRYTGLKYFTVSFHVWTNALGGVAGEGALEGVCRALRLRLELACLLSWGIVATGTTC